MIKLEKVSKTFRTGSGEVHAVREVSLNIEQGEIFGIIGFSGAGKSTLVRCINLLERPTEGTVTVDGTELTKLDEKRLREVRRKIGMIFQHFNLLRSRTVYDNIAFPLKKSSLSKEEKHKKILSLLELVGLSEKKTLILLSFPVVRNRELPLPEHWQMTLKCCCVTKLPAHWTLRPQNPFCTC